MKRDSIIQLGAAAVGAISLALSGGLSSSITSSAGRYQLTYADRAEEGDPPEVALGIAMGAFRGIFVNFLWFRANDLKEKGQYYEAMELARAITTLQPRFPQVWVFHAWNMAYNISVATQTPEERWQWVQAGIRLLRDEGIQANPNNLILHKELAWIFLHKVGGITDDSNKYYKRELAEEWTIVMGDPPRRSPRMRTREGATEAYIEWIRGFANAPDTLAELQEQSPAAFELNQRIDAITGGQDAYGVLRRHQSHVSMRTSMFRAQAEATMGEKNLAFAELIGDPALDQAWDDLLAHLRRRVLIDRYNMEPERMIRYTRKYGPIDWRHPAAHALYWGARGVEESLARTTEANREDFDFVNADRVVIQSLQELYRSGEVYFNYFDSITGGSTPLQYAPHAAFVESYGEVLEELIDRSWMDEDKRPYNTYSAGYENFLRDAVRFFYRRGQRDEAMRFYRELGTYPRQNTHDPFFNIDTSVPIDEFVLNELQDDRIRSHYVLSSEVMGSLQGAYVNGLLANDMELFRESFSWARQAHQYYYETQVRDIVAGGGETRTGQLDPDFRIVAGDVFARILQLMDVEEASATFLRAPVDLQQFAYDFLAAVWKPEIDQLAEAGASQPFEELFPEPPGMFAHREWLRQVAAERAAKAADLDQQ